MTAAGPLPRSAPLDHGVDPDAVLAFLDALEGNEAVEMHSLMVVRGGHVVAEGWWSPYGPERKHLLYSLSKSFTITAIGLAQAEGLLGLDDLVLDHFPELGDEVDDPRSRSLRLRHLAAMASGHTRDVLAEALARDPENPVRGFLLTPPDRDPGTVFAYNQPCTYTLAAVVRRRAKTSLTDYLRPRLLDPLGIADVGWHGWPPGEELGFTGLHARTEDVAKLGLLHLHLGRWDGRQLLPAQWVRQATSKQVDNPDQPNVDWQQGYGYQFWMARHGYRGDGAFGQFCVVLPEQDTVVATTACTEQMQFVLDALWTHLLPGLGRAGDPLAQSRLADRLATLRLTPLAPGRDQPEDWAPWVGGAFPVTRTIAGSRSPSMLTEVAVHQRDDGPAVSLREPGNAVTFPVGAGAWTVSEPVDRSGGTVPVAASGGWADPHTLRLRIVFLETPHRLEVTLSLPERSAVAQWSSTPLGSDRLGDLHSP